MSKYELALLVASFVCFSLSFLNIGGKYNLTAAGLVFWLTAFYLMIN